MQSEWDKNKSSSINNNTVTGNRAFYLGRRKDSQLKGGALSTVIGNTFYGKI